MNYGIKGCSCIIQEKTLNKRAELLEYYWNKALHFPGASKIACNIRFMTSDEEKK